MNSYSGISTIIHRSSRVIDPLRRRTTLLTTTTMEMVELEEIKKLSETYVNLLGLGRSAKNHGLVTELHYWITLFKKDPCLEINSYAFQEGHGKKASFKSCTMVS
jgi:hypothetical protein